MSWPDIDILFESDCGGGYDWSIEALVARTLPDGRREYAHYSDSGCSCDHPYEMDVEYYDLAWDTSIDAPFRNVKESIRGEWNFTQELEDLNAAVRKEAQP